MPTNRNSKKYIPVNRAAVSSKYIPVNRASSLPPKKETFGEKAVGVGKDLVKAIVSPVATMVARPIQLGAMLAGVSTENIDKFTMGGLIAPTPKNSKDVVKDIGRGIETVALGIPATKATKLFGNTIKPISSTVAPAMIGASKLTPKAVKTANVLSKSVGMGAEGAVFGYGQGLEQTGEPLGAETLKTTAMGAGIGAVLPIAGAGLSKVFEKKATTGIESIANKTDDVVNKVTPEQPIVNNTEIPTQAVPEQPIQRKIPEAEYNEIKTKIESDNYDYKDYERADEFMGKDPEYIKQTLKGRQTASLDYVNANGIDDAIDIALTRNGRGVPANAGFTAPAMKDFLIKSGKLTEDQTARLLRSKAAESLSGSSLQSVSPLQKFMNDANKAIKETYKKKIVANKKTVRSLFDGLECKE